MSSRLEFLEKFSANNFALSGAEDNTSGLLNRDCRFTFIENTTGNLPKVQRAKIAYLNFTLDSEDLSFCYKQKRLFLWTIEAAQAAENRGDEWTWPDNFNEEYIHKFQPEPTHKIH